MSKKSNNFDYLVPIGIMIISAAILSYIVYSVLEGIKYYNLSLKKQLIENQLIIKQSSKDRIYILDSNKFPIKIEEINYDSTEVKVSDKFYSLEEYKLVRK